MRIIYSFCIFTKGKCPIWPKHSDFKIFMMMFLLSVLFAVILCRFHWRNQHRIIALLFNVIYFIYREIIHVIFIYALFKAFLELNDKWNIFKASSSILAVIILIFISMQCTWLHIKFIYCAFKGVSKPENNPCTQTVPDFLS